jgi:hypothetical protein
MNTCCSHCCAEMLWLFQQSTNRLWWVPHAVFLSEDCFRSPCYMHMLWHEEIDWMTCCISINWSMQHVTYLCAIGMLYHISTSSNWVNTTCSFSFYEWHVPNIFIICVQHQQPLGLYNLFFFFIKDDMLYNITLLYAHVVTQTARLDDMLYELQLQPKCQC